MLSIAGYFEFDGNWKELSGGEDSSKDVIPDIK